MRFRGSLANVPPPCRAIDVAVSTTLFERRQTARPAPPGHWSRRARSHFQAVQGWSLSAGRSGQTGLSQPLSWV